MYFILFLAVLCLCCCLGFSLISTSCCGVQASHCSGFSRCGAQVLGTQASVVATLRLQNTGSVAVAHGLSCSVAYGIFPHQGSDPSLLDWQADSLQLSHQGSFVQNLFKLRCYYSQNPECLCVLFCHQWETGTRAIAINFPITLGAQEASWTWEDEVDASHQESLTLKPISLSQYDISTGRKTCSLLCC